MGIKERKNGGKKKKEGERRGRMGIKVRKNLEKREEGQGERK
jgi:hypothetical protein